MEKRDMGRIISQFDAPHPPGYLMMSRTLLAAPSSAAGSDGRLGEQARRSARRSAAAGEKKGFMPRESALKEAHAKRGASFEDLFGWVVPSSFGDTSRECEAVREASALFDLSFLSAIEVTG